MCNNSPAELTSPENGWRWSVGPIPGRHRKLGRWRKYDAGDAFLLLRRIVVVAQAWSAVASRRVAVVSREASGVSLGGAATGADLGGSSKYSSEVLEGRGGEGFHGNSS